MKVRYIIVVSFLVLLAAARVILPYATELYLESKLNEQDRFKVEIGDVDYSFIRGGVSIEDVRIASTAQEEDKTFIKFKSLELQTSYFDSLINWRLEGSGLLNEPRALYSMSIKAQKSKEEEGPDVSIQLQLYEVRRLLANMIPFKINSFAISNGQVLYRLQEDDIDFELSSIDFELKTLTNDETRNATASLSAVSTGEGKLGVNIQFDPDATDLKFDLDAELTNLKLKSLNALFKKYASFDLKGGKFSVFIEVSGAGQKFEGYVKPLIKDLNVVSNEDLEDEGLFGLIWEGIVGLVGNVLENQTEDQLGAKVEFTGQLDDPNLDVWQAVESILTNGFIKALAPKLDRQIDFLPSEK